MLRNRITKVWERLQASYLFIPGLMAVGAVVLAVVAETADRAIDVDSVRTLRWIYQGGPDGARAVLSTIAGSMITVAGVAFSITMVALQLASSQLGPRILRNFMRDRGNQIVLGTFIATFLYCLLVLRTVRSVDEVSFVPHVSITVGVLLGLASIGVLIYFIDHVATSIQAPHVVTRIGRDLDRVVDRVFPPEPEEGADDDEESQGATGARERSGPPTGDGDGTDDAPEERPSGPDPERDATAVRAERSGYVQLVDEDALLAAATEADLVISCLRRPGEFVVEDTPVAKVAPAERVDDEVTEDVRSCFLYGSTRSDLRDVEFAVKQLVEIAVRALSPSLNDPYTAMNCVDRLTAALARTCSRPSPPGWRIDDDGVRRVRLRRPTFPGLLDIAFDPIREYGASSSNVAGRLIEALLSLESVVDRPAHRIALLRHGDAVAGAADAAVADPAGRRRVEGLHRLLRQRLDDVRDDESGS